MKKLVLLFAIITTFKQALLSQKHLVELKPKAVYNGITFRDIYFSPNGKEGWIVGDFGEIRKTTDGGITWSKSKRIADVGLNAIFFLNNDKIGWIVGNSGKVLYTIDGGSKWLEYKSISTTQNLNSIYFSPSGKFGVIVGTSGIVYLSGDAGQTWKRNDNIESDDLDGGVISEGGNYIAVFGEYMSFIISKDAGQKWEDKFPSAKANSWGSPNLFSAFFDLSKKIIWVAGENGYVLKTTNNGETWTVNKICDESLYSIWFDPTFQIGFAASAKGKIWKTINGGATWKIVLDLKDNEAAIWAIQVNSLKGTGWACGKNGLLLQTKDAGQEWSVQNTLYRDLHGFAMSHDGETLFIAAGKGQLLKTTNGCKSFSNISPNNFQKDLLDVRIVNNKIWAVAEGYTILTCDTSGSSWKIHYSENTKDKLLRLYISPKRDFLCAVGQNSKFLISTNEGRKWENIPIANEAITFNGIYFSDNGKNGWIVGSQGHIYFSENYGRNWNRIPFSDSTQSLQSISFLQDHSVGYLLSRSSKNEIHLFKSMDGGRSWRQDSTFPYFDDLHNIAVFSPKHEILITTETGNVIRSIDNGKSWFSDEKIKQTYQYLCDAKFDKEGNATIVGHGGVIFRSLIVDTPPTIDKFMIRDSGNFLVPELEISDAEIDNKDIWINFQLSGEFIDGIDKQYLNKYLNYGKGNIVWPKSIFQKDRSYVFSLKVSDGWNIVSSEKELKLGEGWATKMQWFLHWHKAPGNAADYFKFISINVAAISAIYFVLVLLIFLISPIHFVFWHEAVANSRLPFPEKISRFIVLHLIEHNRALDAFVAFYQKRTKDLFESYPDVKSRPIWVPAPFQILQTLYTNFTNAGAEETYIAGLSEIKKSISNERILLSIEGYGGLGKSSMAFAIARWALNGNAKKRLFRHISLPLFINNVDDDLDKICKRRLEYITNRTNLSDILVFSLLKKNRVFAVVDGISEMLTYQNAHIDPEKGAKNLHFVIYTTRKPINIYECTKILPSGLKISSLDMLLDAFTNSYVGSGKFGEEREILRTRIKNIIIEISGNDSEAQIPLSILRLVVERAALLIDQNKNLEQNLPSTLSELIDEYVHDLFRDDPDELDLIEDLRVTALVSLGLFQFTKPKNGSPLNMHSIQIVRPQWLPLSTYEKFVKKEILSKFRQSGILISTGHGDNIQQKFIYDSIAEYLGAKELAIKFRDGLIGSDEILEMVYLSKELNEAFFKLLRMNFERMNLDMSFEGS